MPEKFYVTHIAFRLPEPNRWIQLGFLSRTEKAGPRPYCYGLETDRRLSQNEVDRLVDRGEIGAIKNPHEITKGQRVWLTSKGEIFLANEFSPVNDPDKEVLLGKQ